MKRGGLLKRPKVAACPSVIVHRATIAIVSFAQYPWTQLCQFWRDLTPIAASSSAFLSSYTRSLPWSDNRSHYHPAGTPSSHSLGSPVPSFSSLRSSPPPAPPANPYHYGYPPMRTASPQSLGDVRTGSQPSVGGIQNQSESDSSVARKNLRMMWRRRLGSKQEFAQIKERRRRNLEDAKRRLFKSTEDANRRLSKSTTHETYQQGGTHVKVSYINQLIGQLQQRLNHASQIHGHTGRPVGQKDLDYKGPWPPKPQGYQSTAFRYSPGYNPNGKDYTQSAASRYSDGYNGNRKDYTTSAASRYGDGYNGNRKHYTTSAAPRYSDDYNGNRKDYTTSKASARYSPGYYNSYSHNPNHYVNGKDNTTSSQEHRGNQVRAVVLHAAPTSRRLGEMRQRLEADNNGLLTLGARWLVQEGRRLGKIFSSVVIYLQTPVTPGKLRMGCSTFRTTNYEWDRDSAKSATGQPVY